jgi:two-component system nitrate/nitrite response regulator NarL
MAESDRTTLIAGSTHPLWLRGFVDLLQSLETIDVVGVANDAPHLVSLLETLEPRMMVVESALVIPVRRLLRARHRIPRILIVGGHPHAGTRPVFGPYCSCGYFSERLAPSTIAQMVRDVAPCPNPHAGLPACSGCRVPLSLAPPPLPLTERENEVFVRIGWGQGPSEIATELGIQVKTIEAHRESLKRKLGLTSASDLRAAAFAWRDGDLVPRARRERGTERHEH